MSRQSSSAIRRSTSAAEPDEQVPSRYKVRVGDIDVMVVSDGVLPLPGAMLGHNADPAVRTAWLKDQFLQPDVLEWALNEVVVRSGGRTILIDSGLGADPDLEDRKSTRLNSSHLGISYAVFCLKKKNAQKHKTV